MARELRRLLISPERLGAAGGEGQRRLAINEAEAHYLRRVLRLGCGDSLAVVDGQGRLWTAELAADGAVLLQQSRQAEQGVRDIGGIVAADQGDRFEGGRRHLEIKPH